MHATMAGTDYPMAGIEDRPTLTGLTDPDRLLNFYLCPGCGLVPLKMARAGTYLAMPDARTVIPAHVLTPVDATGGCETFCGSFLAHSLAATDPHVAALYASLAVALTSTGHGTVAPLPKAEGVYGLPCATRMQTVTDDGENRRQKRAYRKLWPVPHGDHIGDCP